MGVGVGSGAGGGRNWGRKLIILLEKIWLLMGFKNKIIIWGGRGVGIGGVVGVVVFFMS